VFAINARKDVLAGLQRVKARLVVQGDGYPRLFVSDRCKNVIREMESYAGRIRRLTGTRRKSR